MAYVEFGCEALKEGLKRPLTNMTIEPVILNGVKSPEMFKLRVAVVGVNSSCADRLNELAWPYRYGCSYF